SSASSTPSGALKSWKKSRLPGARRISSLSRILRDLYTDRAPRAVPEIIPEPIQEPEEEFDLQEEMAEPTWWDLWSADLEQTESILLAARAQAQDVRNRAQTEGEAEGYAVGYQE